MAHPLPLVLESRSGWLGRPWRELCVLRTAGRKGMFDNFYWFYVWLVLYVRLEKEGSDDVITYDWFDAYSKKKDICYCLFKVVHSYDFSPHQTLNGGFVFNTIQKNVYKEEQESSVL